MRLAVGVILGLLATTGASAGDSVSGMTGLSSNLGAPQAGIKIVGMGVLPASSSVNIGSAWSTATFHGTRSGGDAAPLTVILGKMSDGTVRAAFSGLTNWHDEFTVTGVERCGPRYPSTGYDAYCIRRSGDDVIVRSTSLTVSAYQVLN